MANRYWVGGTGNWNDTAKWSDTSGGAGGFSVPTSSDNAYLDGNSGTGTATINASSNCLDIDCTGYTGTLAGTSALSVYGNILFSAGMTLSYSGTITMRATSGTKTITTSGKTFPGQIALNGSGGTFQLADNYTTSSTSSSAFTISAGTFSANSKTVTLNGSGSPGISGRFTGSSAFYALTRTGTSAKTDGFSIGSNIEITSTLTLSGSSSISRLLVFSSTEGTQVTITAATLSAQNVDFRDISGAGAASWNLSSITGLSGDCGGNSGITFTTPTTTTCSGGTTWSLATWSSRVPLPQDTANFSGLSRTITQDMPRIGSVDFTGSSGLTWTTNVNCTCYGSINLTNLSTLTNSNNQYIMSGRSSNSITSAGHTWAKSIAITAFGGTVSLLDAFNGTSISVTAGTFTTNNNSVTLSSSFSSTGTNTRTVNLGSSQITISGNANMWSIASTGLSFNAGTSQIKLTGALTAERTFSGGGVTYNNFWNATSGAYAVLITGSNTFNDFKIDAGRSQKFTAGTTQTVTTFTATGTSGNLITLGSSTTSQATLSKAGGGQISCDYMSVSYIAGSPTNTWYMGTNSTDGGNNSNIYFTAPGAANAYGMLLLF